MESNQTSLQTFINNEHLTLGEKFASRAIRALSQPGLKIKSYAVDCDSYCDTEVLKIEVDQGTATLEIKLRVPK